MKKSNTPQSNEQLIAGVQAICPDFAYIPDEEKYVMALHCAGMGAEAISAVTGRKQHVIAAAVERYQGYVAQLDDNIRVNLNAKILFNAMSTFAACVADQEKIKKLSPVDAIKCMVEIKKLIPELLGLEKEIRDHQTSLSGVDGLDEFGKMLGGGE